MRAYRLDAGPGPEWCVEGNREDDTREVWIFTAPTAQAAIGCRYPSRRHPRRYRRRGRPGAQQGLA